jgi:uncharacterized protein
MNSVTQTRERKAAAVYGCAMKRREAPQPSNSSREPELGAPRTTGVLFGVGIAAGVVGGLAGGGGGIVTVPALDHLTRLRRSEIHGTSTAANVFIAMAGLAFYLWRGGAIDPAGGLGMLVGGIFGAPLGARFAKQSTEALLRLIFILVLVAAVGDLGLHAIDGPAQDLRPLLPAGFCADDAFVAITAGLIGTIVGAWSAAMGLGGGLLAVPVFVLLFGREQHVAEGTSLLVMLPNAVSGTIAHLRQATTSLRLGGVIGVGALLGSALGVDLALHLDARTLLYAFSGLMIVVIAREVVAFYASHERRARERRGLNRD